VGVRLLARVSLFSMVTVPLRRCLRKYAKTLISTALRCRNRRFYAAHTMPPQIVSRLHRNVEHDASSSSSSWLTTLGSAFKRKSNKTNVDEKPWPLSVRIAGYVAIAVAMPITLCTLVAENKSFRDWLEGDRPHDPTDRRMGKRIVSFARTYWTDSNLFHGETEAIVEREKRTATEIAKNLDRDIPVNVYLINQPIMRISLKGDVPVNLSSAAAVGLDYDAGSIFAVEFPDEEEAGQEGEVDTHFWTATVQDGAFEVEQQFSWQDRTDSIGGDSSNATSADNSNAKLLAKSYGEKIREMTQTFSSWHFFEQDSAKESKLYLEKMSPENIRKSELEWREAQLKMQLIDPYCSRDIDEMQLELAQVQRELRRLNRWKWAKSILSR
jgi:hypothetical protein